MTIKQQEREYTELYSETIESLEEAYENGEIDEEELISLKTQTLAELEEALAELRGLTQEDLETYNDNENQEYSMNNNYANFSTASAYLVPAVMDLIDNHYEDPEEAFYDIMEATGIDEDDMEGFLTGQLEATPEFIDIINGIFEETATDTDAALGLQLMGALDRGDTTEDELEESEYEEEYEEEDYEDDEYEEEVDSTDAEAVYSYIDPRVQELEAKMADFELNSELTNRLNEIADFAQQGIQERWLSKAKYDLLLGSFDREEDRVAAFSQTAESNNVDLSTQLYAILFALKADEECGDPRVNFSSYVTERVSHVNSEEEELAKLQVEKMIENRLLFKKY
jgi:hypothetical protein